MPNGFLTESPENEMYSVVGVGAYNMYKPLKTLEEQEEDAAVERAFENLENEARTHAMAEESRVARMLV